VGSLPRVDAAHVLHQLPRFELRRAGDLRRFRDERQLVEIAAELGEVYVGGLCRRRALRFHLGLQLLNAPLRLIELPMDWSQQIDVKVFASVDTSAADDVAKQRFGQVIEMMRDPAQSTFAFVMYPESTPILEAWRAAQELGSVGIQPGLVVANLVIPPEQATTPFVQARRAMQEKYLAEIGERFATPVLQVPLMAQEVKGLEMLASLGEQIYQPETMPVM